MYFVYFHFKNLVLNTVLPITRVLQKQGISGLLNIFTTIKHCAKLKLSYSEALPSQSPLTLLVMRNVATFRFHLTVQWKKNLK